MKITIAVILVGLILGGITFKNKDVHYEAPIQAQEVVVEQAPTQEPTAEEVLYAEKMKIKEQEARLEAKRDIQKEELAQKSAEYDARIAELQKEYDAYVDTKEIEIKGTEAELASFIVETASRN